MAEIQRSPVEGGNLSYYLQGFRHPRCLFGISEPSTVVVLSRAKSRKKIPQDTLLESSFV